MDDELNDIINNLTEDIIDVYKIQILKYRYPLRIWKML